ncbi:hypothetical protein DYB30_002075 [Aphanomyces astaci]|uniref:DDH domain-containing protein n=1 Tax=Aphanomyces astaci TaxID=112090 RepID=A0A397CIV3_APHAT|nr:hypothetical protein DYB30_002075 [Aphanomyces astaci]
MLWPREHFRVAFKQVVSDAIDTHGASVLLLVALDVDSIAAVSILTSLLQAELVAYSMVPVAGYKQMAAMTFSSEIRSIFLINCGAMIDVYSTLKLTDQKVYVIDSHRPLHLANVYDRHGTVVLFDDEVPPPATAITSDKLPSKRKRRLDILQYYRGTFHGAPAATLTFELASQLNMATADKVWLAIVGLTKQFVAQQIDADNYNMLVQKFQDEVLALPSNGGSNDVVHDFKYQWCAADVVHGLSALLEAPLHVARKALADHVPDALQGTSDDDNLTDGTPSAPYWQHSFHLALDALPWYVGWSV